MSLPVEFLLGADTDLRNASIPTLMRPVIRILFLALVPVIILRAQSSESGASSESSEPNLIANAEFEKGTAGWELLNWGKKGTMAIDPNESHDGKPALRVENHEACHSFIRQILTGKPNTRYRLAAYIKTSDVKPANAGEKSGAVLEVGRMGVYTPLIENTNAWTKVTVDFITNETGEIRVGPSLGTDATFATGTAWFAEVSLTEIGGGKNDE